MFDPDKDLPPPNHDDLSAATSFTRPEPSYPRINGRICPPSWSLAELQRMKVRAIAIQDACQRPTWTEPATGAAMPNPWEIMATWTRHEVEEVLVLLGVQLAASSPNRMTVADLMRQEGFPQ